MSDTSVSTWLEHNSPSRYGKKEATNMPDENVNMRPEHNATSHFYRLTESSYESDTSLNRWLSSGHSWRQSRMLLLTIPVAEGVCV
jgi:hypothetical protein